MHVAGIMTSIAVASPATRRVRRPGLPGRRTARLMQAFHRPPAGRPARGDRRRGAGGDRGLPAVTATVFDPRQWATYLGANLLLAATYALIVECALDPSSARSAVLIAFLVPFLDIGIAQSPMLRPEPAGWARMLPGYGADRVLLDGGLTAHFDQAGSLAVGLAWLPALAVLGGVLGLCRGPPRPGPNRAPGLDGPRSCDGVLRLPRREGRCGRFWLTVSTGGSGPIRRIRGAFPGCGCRRIPCSGRSRGRAVRSRLRTRPRRRRPEMPMPARRLRRRHLLL